MKEMKKPVKIAVLAMRKNENGKLGLLWDRGGKIIIYENQYSFYFKTIVYHRIALCFINIS